MKLPIIYHFIFSNGNFIQLRLVQLIKIFINKIWGNEDMV
jgi:hypothetical protein